MASTGYTYEVSLNLVRGRDGQPPREPAALSFEHVNHDDIIVIVERMQGNSGLAPDAAAAVAVGLKLLGEVMLRQKNNALFDPLRGAMREFIGKLKSLPATRARVRREGRATSAPQFRRRELPRHMRGRKVVAVLSPIVQPVAAGRGFGERIVLPALQSVAAGCRRLARDLFAGECDALAFDIAQEACLRRLRPAIREAHAQRIPDELTAIGPQIHFRQCVGRMSQALRQAVIGDLIGRGADRNHVGAKIGRRQPRLDVGRDLSLCRTADQKTQAEDKADHLLANRTRRHDRRNASSV